MTAGILHSIKWNENGWAEVKIKPKPNTIYNMIKRPKIYRAKPGLIHPNQKEGVLIEFYAANENLIYIHELR